MVGAVNPESGRRASSRSTLLARCGAALTVVAVVAALVVALAARETHGQAGRPQPDAPAASAPPASARRPLPADGADSRARQAPGAPPSAAAPGPVALVGRPCVAAPEGMACVPGSAFIMGVDTDDHVCDQPGNNHDSAPTTTPAHRVEVSTFFMDLTEVTNEAYRACVEARDCPRDGPRYRDFSAPTQAITGVSWFSARAFCQAQGKRLPTEAEWELAARGPNGETHPWGNAESDCTLAIIKDGTGRSCGRTQRSSHPASGRVNEVAARPAGRYGLFDMMGNAEEWVADWWSPTYAACGEACQGRDPRGPCGGADECPGHNRRVVRGGSWYWPASHATGYHRRRHMPDNRLIHHFGFRCAQDLPAGG